MDSSSFDLTKKELKSGGSGSATGTSISEEEMALCVAELDKLQKKKKLMKKLQEESRLNQEEMAEARKKRKALANPCLVPDTAKCQAKNNHLLAFSVPADKKNLKMFSLGRFPIMPRTFKPNLVQNIPTTRPKSARPSITDSQKPDIIQIPKSVYLLVRGMNGDVTPVYLNDVIADMAQKSTAKAKQFWKHLRVYAAMEPLSESLHADKKRDQHNREFNSDDQGLVSTGEIMKKFDVRVPVQLLEILKPDEDGKLCAVRKNELLKTCFAFFVDDVAEGDVVHGEEDGAKYRLLVFDENDDDKVSEICDVGEKEIHDYATDFLVTSDRELAAKNDTELASEYLDNGLGRVYSNECLLKGDYRIQHFHSPREQGEILNRRFAVQDRRLLILYHVDDARFFLTEVRKEGLSRLYPDKLWPAFGRRDFSELRIPALEGCLEEMNCLLEFSEDVNAKCNEYGNNALYLAAKEGHFDVVKTLIDAKADYSTALLSYDDHGERYVKCLLDAGANVNACGGNRGFTALHLAVEKSRLLGDEERRLGVIKCLLAGGANVDARDSSGSTPLCLAVTCKEKGLAVIKCLLAAGANVDATDSNGFTPLCLAVMCKNRNTQSLATVEYLLSAGADLNAGFGRVSSTRVGSNGRVYRMSDPEQSGTALHIAVDTAFSRSTYPAPNFDIITRLITAGANVNTRDFNDKKTPLDIAFHKNSMRRPDAPRFTEEPQTAMTWRRKKTSASPAELLRFPDLVLFPEGAYEDALLCSSKSRNCCSRVELIKYLIALGGKVSNVLCSFDMYGAGELINAQESKNRWVKDVLRFIEEEGINE